MPLNPHQRNIFKWQTFIKLGFSKLFESNSTTILEKCTHTTVSKFGQWLLGNWSNGWIRPKYWLRSTSLAPLTLVPPFKVNMLVVQGWTPPKPLLEMLYKHPDLNINLSVSTTTMMVCKIVDRSEMRPEATTNISTTSVLALDATIRGNWSPGDQSKPIFSPDWSLMSISQGTIALHHSTSPQTLASKLSMLTL